MYGCVDTSSIGVADNTCCPIASVLIKTDDEVLGLHLLCLNPDQSRWRRQHDPTSSRGHPRHSRTMPLPYVRDSKAIFQRQTRGLSSMSPAKRSPS